MLVICGQCALLLSKSRKERLSNFVSFVGADDYLCCHICSVRPPNNITWCIITNKKLQTKIENRKLKVLDFDSDLDF